MAKKPAALYANVVSIRLTDNEVVLEFGSNFPDQSGQKPPVPGPDFSPDVRVVLPRQALAGLIKTMTDVQDQHSKAKSKTTKPDMSDFELQPGNRKERREETIMTFCMLAEPSISQNVEIPHEDEAAVREIFEVPGKLLTMAMVFSDIASRETETGTIDNLGEEQYTVLQPIPYQIEQLRADDFLATFAEGNIAIGGDDAQDAYQGLIAEILDTFDRLSSEPRLSPAAIRQLHILRGYIGKT